MVVAFHTVVWDTRRRNKKRWWVQVVRHRTRMGGGRRLCTAAAGMGGSRRSCVTVTGTGGGHNSCTAGIGMDGGRRMCTGGTGTVEGKGNCLVHHSPLNASINGTYWLQQVRRVTPVLSWGLLGQSWH